MLHHSRVLSFKAGEEVARTCPPPTPKQAGKEGDERHSRSLYSYIITTYRSLVHYLALHAAGTTTTPHALAGHIQGKANNNKAGMRWLEVVLYIFGTFAGYSFVRRHIAIYIYSVRTCPVEHVWVWRSG